MFKYRCILEDVSSNSLSFTQVVVIFV